MRKSNLLMLLWAVLVVTLLPINKTFGQEAYAVFENGTLTLKYDDQRPDGAYSIRTQYDNGWYSIRTQIHKVVFDNSFKDYRPISCASWFEECFYLESLEGIKENLNTEDVEYMNQMFFACGSITSLDLSGFNTSKVKNMSFMFYDCGKLRTIYVENNWDVSLVQHSESMFSGCQVLYGEYGTECVPEKQTVSFARIDKGVANPGLFTELGHNPFSPTRIEGIQPYAVLTNGVLSFHYDANMPETFFCMPKWDNLSWLFIAGDFTKVVFDESFSTFLPNSCSCWFSHCSKLTEIENIKYLNTANVRYFINMFYGCSSLTTLDLSGFIIYNAYTDYMFSGCSNLKTIYGKNWDASGSYMFEGCTNLVGAKGTVFNPNNISSIFARIDGGESSPGYFSPTPEPYATFDANTKTLTLKYDNQKPTNAYSIRSSSYNNGWSTIQTSIKKVVFADSFKDYPATSCAYWFYGCTNLTEIVGMEENLNTANVSDLSYMFYDCYNLTSLDLSGFDTKNVTSMNSMFSYCSNLTSLDLSGLDTKNVTNMNSMFSNCNKLTSLDLSGFDTQNVTNMVGMFRGCSNLTSIDLSSFDTHNVTTMSSMFNECSKLTSIDLSGFDTRNVTDMSYLFLNCSKLKTIYVGDNWITDIVTESWGMFIGCNKLYGGKGSTIYDLQSDYYDNNSYDKTYAKIDGGESAPGYLTKVGEEPFESDAYAIVDNNTLTFYFNKNKPDNALEIGEIGTLLTFGNITKLVFDESFKTYKPKKTTNWFAGYSHLTEIIGMKENLSTTDVKNMCGMFLGCFKLTSLDLSGFDTQNVTKMDSMFADCSKLKTIYVGDNWTTDNVTESRNMFRGCNILSGGKGTSMYDYELTDKTYAKIDGGEAAPGYLTKSGEAPFVCNAYAVLENNTLTFYYNKNKPENAIEIGEVGRDYFYNNWKSNVTKVVFNESFKNYKPKNCTNWFQNCYYLTEIEGMKENLNTSDVKNMSYMFADCYQLTSLDLSGFDTHNVTNMSDMFRNCSKLITIFVGDNWKTDNVTSSYRMFYDCNDLIGEKGTSYNSQNTDKKYAIIDGGESAPGYLTKLAPISIAIETAPQKEYIEGEKLNLSGGELLITYNNSTTEKVALSKATISGFDNTKIGEQIIKVSFLDLETEFKVTVIAKAIAIAIAIAYYPQLSYTEGEQFSAENGYLRVIYNNSKIDTVALAEAVIDGYNPNKIGEQILTIRYLGLTTDLKVNVNQKQIINPYTEPKLVVNIYYISSFEELFWFMFDVNHGDVKANAALVNDIIINKDCLKRITEMLKATSKAASVFTPWQPIGTTENPYQGTFDGQGHTISGLYIDDNTTNNVGLFGNVAPEAVIKNLGVTDSYIAGNENVGAICGKSEGTIVNCYTVSEVKGSKNVNPLVGAKETAAVVENCYYLAETPVANDPCAKTAEEFLSGNVAQLLSQGAVVNGVTYSGETFAGVTELPGTDIIPQPESNDNPSTPISSISENNIKVWSYNHTIYIENAPADTKYTIIDLNGRIITTSTTKSTREEINTNKSGILILNIGNQSFKITQ